MNTWTSDTTAAVTRTTRLMIFAMVALVTACGADDAGNGDGASGGDNTYYDAGSSYDVGGSYDTGTSYDAGSADASGAPDWYEPEAPVDGEPSTDPELPQWVENDWIDTLDDNLATFSVDVDTASYTLARDDLRSGWLPDPLDIRVEEFLNFFDYGYEPPGIDDEHPFAVDFEGGPSQFGDGLYMLRMGLQGLIVSDEDRPGANLVFLVDVSGSMDGPHGVGLIQEALRVLLPSLDERDTISMITYAGNESVALEPTSGAAQDAIESAIGRLNAGGSTAGEAGIRLAYQYAEANFVEGGINRIILCTDGDFNVGLTGEGLIQLAETWRDRGVTITSMLFGRYGNDGFLEQLANRANGNYFYIGNRDDAMRTLGRELLGTLMVIAGDLKVQAVLNRDVVARYRIVGYDNRILEDDEFDDDTVDAAEVGAGHDVTAMLEVQLHEDTTAMGPDALVAWVQLRYKPVGSDESVLVEYPLQLSDLRASVEQMSPSARLAMGVAEFAEILRLSRHSEGARFDDILALLDTVPQSADVEELEVLVETARDLWAE